MSEFKYEMIQMDEKSWRIEENGVRSFLFLGGNDALLVDSGYGSGDLKAAVESLTDLPVLLVNTHADGDHLGCNHQFENVYMHPSEFDRYNGPEERKGLTALPVWEGDYFELGDHNFDVLLIPGHTPGSIALLDRTKRILISGDSIGAGMIYMHGYGRNIHAYIRSMEKLNKLRDEFDVIYPSHGAFPLKPDIIDGLIEGAKNVRDGKVAPTDAPFETPAKVYDVGVAKFLY
jgi:glyoxylase-like metal-dependent hydrolase (beta-lactamase superfamily II)